MATVNGTAQNDKILPGKLSAGVVVASGDFTKGDEADTIVAGLGDDLVNARAEGDTIVGDSITFTTGTEGGKDKLAGGVGNDRLHGDATTTMTGATGGADRLSGDAGNDILIGDAVTLTGGRGGKDTLEGGVGNDSLYGDAGPAGASFGSLLGDAIGGDDKLDGGDGDDLLLGDAEAYATAARGGNDRLDGGRDDDILDGGRGDDVLIGGRGEDRFVLGVASGKDVIRDFDTADDVLDLSALFEASGKSIDEIFGNDGTLDDADKFVRASKRGLEIDLGQLFGTNDTVNADRLLILKAEQIDLDQVITSA